MVREVNKSGSSKSTEVRRKSPARTKSPSRTSTLSPEVKPRETIRKTRERSASRKTPERTKSPSRVVKDKSPTRTTKDKSPSRTKRTKSPGRTKSPSRVSPSRALSGDAKVVIQKISVPVSRIDLETGSDDDFPKQKPRATVKGRSRRFELEEILQPTVKKVQHYESFNSFSSNEVRRLTRSSQSQERVVHLKHFDAISKKGEFSDDEITATHPEPIKKKTTTFWETLGLLTSIFYIPGFAIGIYLLCDGSKCTWGSLPDWRKFLSLSYFFDLQSFLGYSAVAVLVALLSALPFGGRKVCSLPSKQPKFTYVINGLFVLVVVVSSAIALEYYGFKIADFVVNHVFHLVVSSILFGTLCSIILYVKSFYVPVSGLNSTQIDSSFLSGFFYGREVNPRLGNVLDFKIYLLRLYSVSLVIIDGALLVKGLQLDSKLGPAIQNLDWKPLLSHPTFLVLVLFHLIYFIGHLVYEARALSSYYMQYEAPGFGTNVGVLLYPFQLIIQTKYVLDYGLNYATWELIVASLIYIVGFVIFTVSNNQKDAFRRNPYSAVSTKFESIPTSQGKKILCSGCWGWVRQPNITGDILVHLALLRFGVNGYPAVGILSIIYMLVGRAVVNQADCKSKYGGAWDKYCQKVKYILVPKVY